MKNTFEIKFKMNKVDWEDWKSGSIGKSYEGAHPITKASFDTVISIAGKFTSFQHLKNDYKEVEIHFNEKDIMNLISFTVKNIDGVEV